MSIEVVKIGLHTLYRGDCLEVLPTLAPGSVDDFVTDAPYSSGGAFRGDRTNNTIAKYVNSCSVEKRAEFSGDNRDQRAFLAWCTMWMSAARYVCRPGGTMSSFIDWRQLPVMTDAVQCAGWVWRNIGTWWKPGCRMQRGRFSSSAEFVVYATNGPHASDGESARQNVFCCPPVSGGDKEHIAEKPLQVGEWLIGLTLPSGRVCDPFMGSGKFGEAAAAAGRSFIGVELDGATFDLACRRIEAAHDAGPMFRNVVKDEPAPNLFAETPA